MIEVRRAVPGDADAVIAMVRALAEFEKLPIPSDEAAQRLIADAMATPPRFELWVALLEGAPVGYAATATSYSTFLAKPTLYLDDLFVIPAARQRGVGSAVMNHLEAVARQRGCGRFEWLVLDWNQEAIEFYQRRGATVLQNWRFVRKLLD